MKTDETLEFQANILATSLAQHALCLARGGSFAEAVNISSLALLAIEDHRKNEAKVFQEIQELTLKSRSNSARCRCSLSISNIWRALLPMSNKKYRIAIGSSDIPDTSDKITSSSSEYVYSCEVEKSLPVDAPNTEIL